MFIAQQTFALPGAVDVPLEADVQERKTEDVPLEADVHERKTEDVPLEVDLQERKAGNGTDGVLVPITFSRQAGNENELGSVDGPNDGFEAQENELGSVDGPNDGFEAQENEENMQSAESDQTERRGCWYCPVYVACYKVGSYYRCLCCNRRRQCWGYVTCGRNMG